MRRGPGGRDRGQIIILAAFVIAATFVGLALVLNSGIYAENLSSRETTDTDGALSFTLATDEAIAGAYEQTNAANESSASDAEATFGEVMDNWTRAQQRNGAAAGIGVDVERTAHVGWRLEQGTDRQYTDSADDGNWTLATGASDVAAFEMDVDRESLYDASTWGGVNSSFNVRVDDGSSEWRLHVFRESGDVVVHAGAPGAYSDVGSLPNSETCRDPDDEVLVDLRNESLDGSSCPALNFSDDLDGPVDLAYRNATMGGEQVNGTYTVVVNGSSAAETSNFDVPGGADPTAQGIVYSATWASHYGRAELSHERSGRYMVREETYAN
jgi:hypothetical protein